MVVGNQLDGAAPRLDASRMSDLETAKKALLEGIASPKVEALVEAMFLAATADGELASEEMLQFTATLGALTDKAFDGEAVAAMLETLTRRVREEGRQARLAAIAQRLPEPKTRETALILAAAITASDGDIKSTENDLLADLAEALLVEPGRASELISRVQRRA